MASFRDLETQSEAQRPGLGFLNTRNLGKRLSNCKCLSRFRILSMPPRRRGTRNNIILSLVPHFRGDKPKFRNDVFVL